MIADPDPAKAERAMAAMMQMTKLDIAKLREAAGGRPRGGRSKAAADNRMGWGDGDLLRGLRGDW